MTTETSTGAGQAPVPPENALFGTSSAAAAPVLTRCDQATAHLCAGFHYHHPRIDCTDGEPGHGHPARVARCLPDGTHVCPLCDPTWPYSTTEIRRALTSPRRPHPSNARLLRDEDPEKDGAL